ncbi:MAG: hypothetical protein ACFFER_14980 [Candidatus Thorarchaeota archaeon]
MQLDSQTISIMIAASSVVIGVIFSMVSIYVSTRNATRSRQAQIFLNFHSEVSKVDFFNDFFQIIRKWTWTDANDFAAKYGDPENLTDYNIFVRVSMQFDSLGSLVRNKLTAIRYMPRGLAIMVTSFWERFIPIASELEAIWENADIFGEIEYLYNEIKKARVSVLKDS